MTAFFSGTWAGMGMLQDLDRGVLERFLATPARRSALVFSHVVRNGIQSAIQAVIVLVVALALGATNGGVRGWTVITLAGVAAPQGVHDLGSLTSAAQRHRPEGSRMDTERTTLRDDEILASGLEDEPEPGDDSDGDGTDGDSSDDTDGDGDADADDA